MFEISIDESMMLVHIAYETFLSPTPTYADSVKAVVTARYAIEEARKQLNDKLQSARRAVCKFFTLQIRK